MELTEMCLLWLAIPDHGSMQLTLIPPCPCRDKPLMVVQMCSEVNTHVRMQAQAHTHWRENL